VKFALQYTAQHVEGFGIIEQGAGQHQRSARVDLAESKDLLSAPTSNQ
jgi:hypothetical protein